MSLVLIASLMFEWSAYAESVQVDPPVVVILHSMAVSNVGAFEQIYAYDDQGRLRLHLSMRESQMAAVNIYDPVTRVVKLSQEDLSDEAYSALRNDLRLLPRNAEPAGARAIRAPCPATLGFEILDWNSSEPTQPFRITSIKLPCREN